MAGGGRGEGVWRWITKAEQYRDSGEGWRRGQGVEAGRHERRDGQRILAAKRGHSEGRSRGCDARNGGTGSASQIVFEWHRLGTIVHPESVLSTIHHGTTVLGRRRDSRSRRRPDSDSPWLARGPARDGRAPTRIQRTRTWRWRPAGQAPGCRPPLRLPPLPPTPPTRAVCAPFSLAFPVPPSVPSPPPLTPQPPWQTRPVGCPRPPAAVTSPAGVMAPAAGASVPRTATRIAVVGVAGGGLPTAATVWRRDARVDRGFPGTGPP